MERLWKAAFAVGGVAAIGFFVFWSLNRQLLSLPIFAQLSPNQTFIIMLVFLALTFLSLLLAVILHARQGGEKDDILPMYERLREGLSSPEENFLLIERMANSTDPKKARYLREACSLPHISFGEVAAINAALSDLQSKKQVVNLKERVRAAEMAKIEETMPDSKDELVRPILTISKYWRFINRKNHPLYDKMNAFIAIVMVKGFTPEAMQLSKELQQELSAS